MLGYDYKVNPLFVADKILIVIVSCNQPLHGRPSFIENRTIKMS